MSTFPVPLDNLIDYVKALHSEGGPLDHLADAFVVSAKLDEQSDALIGHFVDQARRSGASWSQIGDRMGVSKQAVQKRFVPKGPTGEVTDLVPEGQLYSRFTPRSRNVLAAACRISNQAGAAKIDEPHLTMALLSEPEGLAAKIMAAAGAGKEQIGTAFQVAPAAGTSDSDPAALRTLHFTDAAKDDLKGALKAALRLGHNYIGTEHLLLGVLFAGADAAEKLGELGVTVEFTERHLAQELKSFKQ